MRLESSATAAACSRLARSTLAALALLWLWAGGASASTTWKNGYIPNVPVVDQDGRSLKFYDDVIRDKVVVVNFIYTSCRDLCPLMTARLGRLQEILGDAVGRDIFFVSVSIDPEHDTPEKLKEHAEAFRVGPGWLFLTGQPADIGLIRHRLGERSRERTDHRNMILLGNDRIGSWARDSAFSDLNTLANNVRAMDPAFLHGRRPAAAAAPAGSSGNPVELPGQILFTKTCASCHTIGRGDRVGPDLAGIVKRRDRRWLADYLAAPNLLRQRQDPIAMELASRYRAVRMPNLSLSPEDIEDVLSYLTVRDATPRPSTGDGGNG